jgi:predicted PurR-regulated permease PerM
MNGYLAGRDLLRVGAVFFGLFLVWRFLAEIAATALLLATGLLLAVALSGPVETLHRHKVPRPVASVLIALAAAIVLGLGGYLLLPVLADQARQLISTAPSAFSQLGERVESLAGKLGLSVGSLEPPSASTLASWTRQLLGGVLGLFGSMASTLLGLLVVVFVPLYLVAVPDPVVGWVVRLFPPDRRDRAREVLSKVRVSLLRWLEGRLVSMAIVGVLSIGALYFIGIPGALFLGLLTGLVCFIPLIGPVISVFPPLLLGFAGNPIDALWVLLAYLGIQQVESNLLTPLIMQRAASVHPAVVIATVTAGGAAFGIMGALLAVPVVVVAGVLTKELWFRRLEEDPKIPEDRPSQRKVARS